MDSIIKFSDTVCAIICSGLTEKTRLSFTSSNTSFTECVRRQTILPFFHQPPNDNIPRCTVDDTVPSGDQCNISQHNFLNDNSVYKFTYCTFASLSTSSDGGALYCASCKSLSIEYCTFKECQAGNSMSSWHGGGAVFITSGTFSAFFTSFLSCRTTSFGGGILAESNCASSSISLCTFISCIAQYGGGVNTFFGPTSDVSSTRFISCTGKVSAGGFYHDSNKDTSSLSVSNCLFACNTADSDNDTRLYRGGGGYESFRTEDYPSKYYFSFFYHNVAKKGVGHDITSNSNPLPDGSIVHCFTTTAENSFCNAGIDQDNWLPQGTLLSRTSTTN